MPCEKMERVSERILITGYIGFGNAGDEAIARVVTGQLREQVPGAEITIVSGNPAQTAEAYGVRAIGWRDPLAIAEAVRHTDLTILGGGGLFQDYWGFDPAAILTREHWGLSFYVTPALLSAVYAKPLMLYAIGVGPLLSEHGRKYTKVAGDIASRITVRDMASKDLFESLGVCTDKITVTADPAFNFTPAPEAADLGEVREWKSNGPAIAVCLRTWNFGADSTFCDREVAAALDEVLAEEGGRILFVPFQAGDDLYVARRVFQQMRHREKAALLAEPCSPEMLAGIVANADLVLGMRLHSVIFSLSAQVPFVALEYDPKVGGLAELTGFQEFTLPFGGIEAYVLAGRMRQALRERERFRERAGAVLADLRIRARENAVIAAELLHRGVSTTDYGADARTLIGRMLTAQVGTAENLVERVQACCEALDQPVAGVRPLEMADGIVGKVKEIQTRVRELEGAQVQLTEVRQEADRLRWELQNGEAAQKRLEDENLRTTRALQDARRQADTVQERLAAESRKTTQLSLDLQRAGKASQQAEAQVSALRYRVAGLERQIAPHESKTFGGIAKRALQVVLDGFQMLTPGPLRSAVRKYYLNWFYFRIYPERRAGAARDN
jgi:polysaccharide pyruvyl transferase CsaB